MQYKSIVNNIQFSYPLSNNKTYAIQNNIRGFSLLKYWFRIFKGKIEADERLKKTLRLKICYYGPFKGEFGHFTAHTLPFLMYLHKNNVKIIYCGMELHKPFLVDESGRSIVHQFFSLRDFFHEIPPSSNSVVPPQDVLLQIKQFEIEAAKSKLPFWNIGDDFYYWFIHRHWLGRGHTYLYDLSKVYKSEDENAVCIFPRSKGAKSSHNNGEAWDYQALIELIKPFYNKVYVVGHPSQSLSLIPSEKIEMRITTDNSKILEACSNSRLIITQHSGVNNLGEYVKKPVLIIYKGGNKISDIGSMNNTLLFRKYLKEEIPLSFAFNEAQVIDFIKQHQKR